MRDLDPSLPVVADHQIQTPRRFEATTLMGARNEVELVHQGAVYRLRLTRQGKLILTK